MICVTTFDLINAHPHFIISINFAKKVLKIVVGLLL